MSSANRRAKSHFQVRTSERKPIFRCPPLRCPPLGPPEYCWAAAEGGGGGKTYPANLGGGKRTAECALQNHFWRPQQLGWLVWSAPLSFKGNHRESPKKGGGTYRRWGVQKRFWGGVFRRIYGMFNFSTPLSFPPPLAAL